MAPRFLKHFLGFLLLLAGIGFAAAVWLVHRGQPSPFCKLEAAGSGLAVLGLAIMVLPGPREERVRRGDDLWGMTPLQMITWRWWLVLAATLLVAWGHEALLR